MEPSLGLETDVRRGRGGPVDVGLCFAFVLLTLQLTLLWAFPHLPLVDGPTHKYSAWVYRQLETQESPKLAEIFEKREGWFYPNATYSLFLVRASRWLSLDQAEKLASSVYVVAMFLAFRFLFTSLGGRAWWPQVLLLSLTLNYLFFMGFLNFLWGLPLALAAVGAMYRLDRQPSPKLVVLTNLLLVLAFWSHLVSFCLALASAGFLTLWAWRRRFLISLSGWLPATLVAVTFRSRSADTLSDWQYRDTLWERLWRVISGRVATSFGGLEIPMAAILGLLLLLVALFVVARRHRDRLPLSFAGLILTILGLTLAVPRGAGAGFFIDDRLALFFWLLTIAAVGFSKGRLAGAMATLATVLCLLQTLHQARLFRQFDEAYSTLLATAAAIPDGSEMFAYSFLEPVPPGVVQPLADLNARLALAKGSASYLHFQAAPRHSGHFPVRYTEAGLSRYLGERSFTRIDPSEFAGFLDYVVVHGSSHPVETTLTAGYGYRLSRDEKPTRVYERTGVSLEEELMALAERPDAQKRQQLLDRLASAPRPDTIVMEQNRIVGVNLHSDQWTRGSRPAALIVTNLETEPIEPVLRIRGAADEGALPMTLYVDDGRTRQTLEFTRTKARRITLAGVDPGAQRLFIFWTDRGWDSGDEYTPRRLGARLMAATQ